MITAAQLRAARALAGVDQRKLAELSGLSLPTIQRMETSEDLIRGNVDSFTKLSRSARKPRPGADQRGGGQPRRGARRSFEERRRRATRANRDGRASGKRFAKARGEIGCDALDHRLMERRCAARSRGPRRSTRSATRREPDRLSALLRSLPGSVHHRRHSPRSGRSGDRAAVGASLGRRTFPVGRVERLFPRDRQSRRRGGERLRARLWRA